MEIQFQRKPRVLCLHGFRTSAEILRKQIQRGSEPVLRKLDLVFIDAPFPARGRSDIEGLFDPPYYEWFQSSKGFTEYYNFDECLAYLEDYMMKHGPFDGLLGFSQFCKLNNEGKENGEKDFLKEPGIALLESFQDPFVIYHPNGHVVPRLDDKGEETLLRFVKKIEKLQLHEG
ncbi:hypothetical protein RHGRI_022412 [Rhododendron griersonianum]|uniref:Serine hydrolase domain-containing protein n=1 Tax=Rhododendron griersonianum TaxID=479676 RepID=A0AAV6J0N2_9ERIC|nr:hypothetical protein RHGRI_022412 [Rhododendron griersonianum]